MNSARRCPAGVQSRFVSSTSTKLQGASAVSLGSRARRLNAAARRTIHHIAPAGNREPVRVPHYRRWQICFSHFCGTTDGRRQNSDSLPKGYTRAKAMHETRAWDLDGNTLNPSEFVLRNHFGPLLCFRPRPRSLNAPYSVFTSWLQFKFKVAEHNGLPPFLFLRIFSSPPPSLIYPNWQK